jgi:hypothetical protein
LFPFLFNIFNKGGSGMNNTALRAGAKSANKTHMVFTDEEHERFYYEKLEQAGVLQTELPTIP